MTAYYTVTVHDVNEVYISIDCEDGIAAEIADHFTFEVPGAKFTPKYRARLWDGKIRLFNIRTRKLYRGLIRQVKGFCDSRGYGFSYAGVVEQNFTLEDAVEFINRLNPKYGPRDYQLDAFVHGINTKRSLLLSPTASGKSLILYLLVRYMEEMEVGPGLIIVPTVSLVEQLYSDFKEYSETNGWDVETNCHRIYQGMEKFTTKTVTISTWQSVYTMDKKYFNRFNYIFGDEAHLFKAKSLVDIMTGLTNAEYRIGTTGTLDGTKTHKMVLEGLFGQVYKVTSTKELMDQNHLAKFDIKCVLLKHPENICVAAKKFTYAQEIEYLVLNERRNKFISNLAKSLQGNTLVLYQYVDKHGKILFDLINNEESERKSFFVYGKTDVTIREDIRGIVEKEKDAIIVASFGTFSTGINIKNLHNIIFASPSKSRVRNLQSIGRGLRTSDTKSEASLYDIADDLRYKKHENFTFKHFQERIKIYNEEQFDFKVFKLELKG